MLRTERLYLRNFCTGDAAVLFDYRNDARCSRYQRYDDTSKEFLQKFVSDFACSQFLSMEQEQHYAVARSEDGVTVGDLSVFYTEKDNCFTIGITVAPQFQRQGYAYELLREVIAGLQNRYPAVDIVALVEKENTPSLALFKKLGFAEECYAESIASYVLVIYGEVRDVH